MAFIVEHMVLKALLISIFFLELGMGSKYSALFILYVILILSLAITCFFIYHIMFTAATTAKAAKDWSLPRFWVSICSYNKQPVKKNWGRILGLAWLKFTVVPLRR